MNTSKHIIYKTFEVDPSVIKREHLQGAVITVYCVDLEPSHPTDNFTHVRVGVRYTHDKIALLYLLAVMVVVRCSCRSQLRVVVISFVRSQSGNSCRRL